MSKVIDLDTVAKAFENLRKELAEVVDHFGQTILKEVQGPPSQEGGPMEVELDVLKVKWRRSNKTGGGDAAPGDAWAWAFATRQDGTVPSENRELVQALDHYGTIRSQGYEVKYGSNPKFLNRTKVKK